MSLSVALVMIPARPRPARTALNKSVLWPGEQLSLSPRFFERQRIR
jgi:hypothetical protein